MFRVPLDTVFRRASVTSLLVLTTALSACGGGDEDPSANSSSGQGALEAQSGSATASTPASSSSSSPSDVMPGGIVAKKLTKTQAAAITDHAEDGTTIAAASDTPIDLADTKKQIEKFSKAFKAAGEEVKIEEAGSSESVGGLTAGKYRVLFFASEQKATEVTRNYQQLMATRPGFARVDVAGSRMWLYSNSKKLKKSEITAYRKLKSRIEGDV